MGVQAARGKLQDLGKRRQENRERFGLVPRKLVAEVDLG